MAEGLEMLLETLRLRPFWRLFRAFGGLGHSGAKPACSDQQDRARRAFVLEMMEAHPEAFQHEQDVQCMMHYYPSRF
ncbi:hypothetical protein [Sulfitobacter aestuariivivens]|uniref:Uncharacterized protein n=1 Tax=Sulfitobacter aestuariivivens TaxID=2766981 RepID=A0A927CZJ9_9RHOB|nr:hypothetical protein [Sulfitobacter aestuariivivens]MBD3662313.1 hypothetical protein [Sulfitobacter aestuariivivens]